MVMRSFMAALVMTALTGCSGVSSSAVCEPESSDPCNDQGQGSLDLTFPSALQGVDWQLVAIERGSGEQDVSGLASTLLFKSAVVTGKTCNSFGAEVAAAGPDVISAGSFDSTQMGCSGPPGEMDRLVQQVLGDGVTWKRDQARLTLTREDVTLTYLPAGPPQSSLAVAFYVAYDAAGYDAALVRPALAGCAELPGASRADFQMDSSPPIDVVTFTGSDSERQAVEDCLLLVPAAKVSVR